MESKNNLSVSQSDTVITRTPAHVAADINKIKMKTAVVLAMSAVEMGRLLCEAKSLVPHGEWGAWLEVNVDFSESKAQTLMRCYKEYGDGQIDMISGTSDLDFFAMLTVSQMDALLALPKPERREFVEEHREELESGDMSVRDMKAEIAKLKSENEGLQKVAEGLNTMLEEERSKPVPEPMVQETIVYQPSPEKIEEIRAAEEKRLKGEFETARAAVIKEYESKLTAAEREKAKAVKEASEKAKDAGELHEKLKKIDAAHKADMEKLAAEHERAMAEAEEKLKKQAKVSTAGADGNVVRIQIALEDFKRNLTAVSSVLGQMRAEGEEQAAKADKLQAKVEKILGSLIAEAGWTVC